MTYDDARRAVRKAVEAQGGRVAFAKRAKIDPGTLGGFLEGTHWPQARSRTKIEQALDWEPGRIMDLAEGVEDLGSGSVIEAIQRDPNLLPEAREHLMKQYGLLLRLGAPARDEDELRAAMISDIEQAKPDSKGGSLIKGAAKRPK